MVALKFLVISTVGNGTKGYKGFGLTPIISTQFLTPYTFSTIGPIPWGHSGPLSRIVVVVVAVVDIARRLHYSYSWRATSDTW